MRFTVQLGKLKFARRRKINKKSVRTTNNLCRCLYITFEYTTTVIFENDQPKKYLCLRTEGLHNSTKAHQKIR